MNALLIYLIMQAIWIGLNFIFWLSFILSFIVVCGGVTEARELIKHALRETQAP